MDDTETDGPPVVSANAARQLRATVRVRPESAPADTGIIAGAAILGSLVESNEAIGTEAEAIRVAPPGASPEAHPRLADAERTAVEAAPAPALAQASAPQTAPLAGSTLAGAIPLSTDEAPSSEEPRSRAQPAPEANFAPPPAIPPETTPADPVAAAPTAGPPPPAPTGPAQSPPPPTDSRIITREATGAEDTPLALDIELLDPSGAARLLVSGLPPGATLSAGEAQPDGSWLVSKADLAGLRLIPAADWSGDAVLSLRVYNGTPEARPGDAVASLPLRIAAVADTPELAVQTATGGEDRAIALDIRAALTDRDGSEALAIRIDGIPAGATLSAGLRGADGSWTLSPADLAGLTLTPPRDFAGDIRLSVTASATETAGDVATTTRDLLVTVASETEASARLEASGSATEDQWSPLAFRLDSPDASEGLAAETRIEGLPSGAALSQGSMDAAGVWTVSTAALLAGQVALRPPSDSDATFTLTFHTELRDTQGAIADRRAMSTTAEIRVAAVADAPTLSAGHATGLEDQAIALDLSAALRDTDGSETLALTLLGVPEGAQLSAGQRLADGSWSIPAGALAGLTLTAPADFSGNIALTLRGIATEAANGSAASVERHFTVQVDPVVDGGALSASAAGEEDTAISLAVQFGVSPDASEAWEATAIIRGVPPGAQLSQGRALGGGAWEVDQAELAAGRVSLAPPADSDADIALSIEARITDRQGGSASRDVTAALTLRVDAVADAPAVSVANSTGAEDSAIPLTGLAASLTDTDGSETLSLRIAGVPAEATLSHGTRNPDGTWSVTQAELSGLSLTPPRDFAGIIQLELRATSTEHEGGSVTSVGQFSLTVTPVADAAAISGGGQGQEDSWVSLHGSLATTDRDGSESLGPDIIIRDVPAGAILSHGTETAPGTWTVPRTQFETGNVAIRPPANSDADFSLRITATTHDGQSRAETTASITVTVRAVADAPAVSVANSTGAEDSAIRLTGLGGALTDTDGSETLSFVLSGVPSGATLNRGSRNSDGSWSLTPAQLADASLIPPAHFAGQIQLTLTAVATEADRGAAPARSSATFIVTVDAVADAGRITGQSSGREDEWTLLRPVFSTPDTDGSESWAVTTRVTGLPAGAMLNQGTEASPGVWDVSTSALRGGQVRLRGAPDSDADFTLSFETTLSDTANGRTDTRIVTGNVVVTIQAVADAPVVQAPGAAGLEDRAIALNLGAALTDTDGSETLSLRIEGVPADAMLSHGTRNTDGSWQVAPADLPALALTPPKDFSGPISLTLVATASDQDGSSAVTRSSFTVTVEAVADAPGLRVANAMGAEDSSIAVRIAGWTTDADGSETLLGFRVLDVPPDVSVSAGGQTLARGADGSFWVEAGAAGTLRVTPPANSDSDFQLRVIAVAEEPNGSRAESAAQPLTVWVNAVADAPVWTHLGTSGAEDTAIALNLGARLADTDGSERLFFVIDGLPTGAVLSAGTYRGPGSWSLTAEEAAGATITPPRDFSGIITLSVSAIAQERDGGHQTLSRRDVTIAVAGVIDTTDDRALSSGREDTPIALDLAPRLRDSDGSERLVGMMEIAGVPGDATLRLADGRIVETRDGVAWIDVREARGVTLTLAVNSDAEVGLTITATVEDGGGTRAQVTRSLIVDAIGVADAPSLEVGDDRRLQAQVGTSDRSAAMPATRETHTNDAVKEDGGWSSLPIHAALNDTDGSERLHLWVRDVPDGFLLSAGIPTGDGAWLLRAEDIKDLAIRAPAGASGEVTLRIQAVATEAEGDVAQTDAKLTLIIAPAGDGGGSGGGGSGDGGSLPPPASPDLAVEIETSREDGSARIFITLAAQGRDQTLGILIEGLPEGARPSAGTYDPERKAWVLRQEELDGLSLDMPRDWAGGLEIKVSAIAVDPEGGTARSATGARLWVEAVADGAGISASPGAAVEDQAIALNLSASALDRDGSEEVVFVVLSNLPSGATILPGAGIQDRGDGSWQVEGWALGQVRLQPPENAHGTLTLTVTATTREASNSDEATSSRQIAVVVAASPDAPLVNAQDASGREDTAIVLSLSAALVDRDGSEVLSVVVSGMPQGARLSAGINNGDGSWTLTPDQLPGLTITPPRDWSGSMDLVLAAHALERSTGGVATSRTTFRVQADNVADAPIGDVVATANGAEDRAIGLEAVAQLTDRDGSETLHLVITGVPEGASFSAGERRSDGHWEVPGERIAGLTFTPPANFSGTLNMNVRVTARESDGTEAASVFPWSVTVTAVADAPVLSVAHASGREDSAIALNIAASLTDTDGSESIARYSITGVPAGATLSAGQREADGSWTLAPADLAGLRFNPPADFAGQVSLSVTAIAREGANGSEALTTATLQVTVTAVADAPVLSVAPASGDEDIAVPLNLMAALADRDGSETMTSLKVLGLPEGFSLSAGTSLGGGAWSLQPTELAGLSLRAPQDWNGTVQLTLQATASEAGSAATTSSSFSVTLSPVNDAPALTLAASAGAAEGEARVALLADVAAQDVDSTQMGGATITLSGGAPGEGLGFAGHSLVQSGALTMIGATGIELIREADGSVTLSGAAPRATYVTVLESLTLETADAAGLAAGNRQVQVTLRDDAGLAAATQSVFFAVEPSLIVGDGSDQILAGTAGHDSFTGSVGDETMLGGAGADVFTIAMGGGFDRVEGGDGSWIDRLNIDGAGAPGEGNWTLIVTNQAVAVQDQGSLDFSEPASGQILFSDGGQVEFSGIERITW